MKMITPAHTAMPKTQQQTMPFTDSSLKKNIITLIGITLGNQCKIIPSVVDME